MPSGIGRGFKFLQWFFGFLQLLCSIIILSVTAYAVASSGSNTEYTDSRHYSVIGISVVALLYSVASLLALYYMSVHMFSSFMAIMFDLAFVGAFIFVAVVHRDGDQDCNGELSGSNTAVSCRLQKAVLATAISACLLFLFSFPIEVGLVRHHLRERRLGLVSEDDEPGDSKKAGRGGFFAQVFRRNTVKSQDPENLLPEHTHPEELERGHPDYRAETTLVDNPYSSAYNKYETGYGYGHHSPPMTASRPNPANDYRYERPEYI